MSEFLNLAYDSEAGDNPRPEETISKLISLVGSKRRVLCIGSSTLPLANALSSQASCEITLIADPSDYLNASELPKVKLITDALESVDLLNRFGNDDFDVVILADTLSQIQNYSQVLARILGHFKGALIISAPQLIDNTKALVIAQNKELQRLKTQLQTKEDSLAWYAKRLKEHLVNHYKLEKTAKERLDFETKTQDKIDELNRYLYQKDNDYKLLHDDRERILHELSRLNRYSPDRLPAPLRIPLKLAIGVWAYGIFEPFRLLKKKAN